MPKHLNSDKLEKKFSSVTKSKESIQSLSSWIITHKSFHNEICFQWLESLEKSSISHRLTLFYVANDVLQHCRKKNAPEFRVAFAEVLEDAVQLVKEDKVRQEVLRMINIWNQRNVYAANYLSDLIEVLSGPSTKTPVKEVSCQPTHDIVHSENSKKARILANFKPSSLIACLQEFTELAKRTEVGLEQITPYEELANLNVMSLERKLNNDTKKVYHNVTKACKLIENFLKDADLEVTTATEVIKLIEDSQVYYSSQNEEVRRVVHAYRIFGKKLKSVQQKLNEKTVSLPGGSSAEKSPSPTFSDCELSLHSPPSVSEYVIADNFSPASTQKLDVSIPHMSSSVSSDSAVSDATAKSQSSPLFSPSLTSPVVRSNLDKHLQSLTNKQKRQQQHLSPKSPAEKSTSNFSLDNSFMSIIRSPVLASPTRVAKKDPTPKGSPSTLIDPRKKKTDSPVIDQKSPEIILDTIKNHSESSLQDSVVGNHSPSVVDGLHNSDSNTVKMMSPLVQQTVHGSTNSTTSTKLTTPSSNSLNPELFKGLELLTGILGNNTGAVQKDKNPYSKTLPFDTILKVLGNNFKVPCKSSPLNTVTQVTNCVQKPSESISTSVADESDNLIPMDMELDSDNES